MSISKDSPERFDAIVIGSGQAGNPLSKALSNAGWKTSIIEKHYVGGSCINYGCTPSKTLWASARAAYIIRRSSDYGIHASSIKINMKEVYNRKKKMVESFREGTLKGINSSDNLTLIRGEAFFSDKKTLTVKSGSKTKSITSDKIFIDTGSRPDIPPIKGLDKISYLNSTSIMELQEIPKHLLIIGGGYIGVEFAQMFKRFGSKVTIIQKDIQLLSKEDKDIADEIKNILEEDGIKILFQTKIKEAYKKPGGGITLKLENNDGNKTLSGTHILIAAGQKPNTEELNLKAAGINADDKGYIKVNSKLETNIEGIYALGDVKGGPAFTHISYDDYRIVRDNLLNGANKTIENRILPYTVFIDPQLGRVGLNEKQAKEKEIKYSMAKMPMSNVARAKEMSETRGVIKVLVDPDTEEILGCAVLGIEGGELAAMLQIAIMGKLKYSALKEGIFSHPTLSESFNNLFSKVE